jgi:hypothetical protein
MDRWLGIVPFGWVALEMACDLYFEWIFAALRGPAQGREKATIVIVDLLMIVELLLNDQI